MKESRIWTWPECSLELHPGRTAIAGILNVTPDSFSDGGCYLALEAALGQARRMWEAGADIIDIGGQSTRPGHDKVSLEEELKRVIPLIKILATSLTCPISIDTDKAEVAEAAIRAGAHIINDESGGDQAMARTAARLGCPVILMHWPHNRVPYENVVEDVLTDLKKSVLMYQQAGVARENLILDPGLGFAKDYEENMMVLASVGALESLGYPLLVGASRKSFIGKTTQVSVADKRLAGSLAAAAWCALNSVAIVRVHDVLETRQMLAMMEALMERTERPWMTK